MSDQWFYAKSGQRHGPLDASQLRRLASNGELDVADLVWKAGMREWLPAARIKGLFSRQAVNSSPPPLPVGPFATSTATPVGLGQLSLLRVVAWPARALVSTASFFVIPGFIKWCNPEFVAYSADPILRVVLIVLGVGLSVTAWRISGRCLDLLCEPRL
jgi:hypothetical protein